MTIERGMEWGETILTPDEIMSIGDDHDLAKCNQSVFVSLVGGDLFESLGSPRSVVGHTHSRLVHIDALQCTVSHDDSTREVFAASSVVVGSWISRHEFVCVTNGGMWKGRDVTPRAHPNDGKWDVLRIQTSMGIRQRLIARRRSKTGTHIPHPAVAVHRVSAAAIERTSQRQRLWIDGVSMGDWTSVSCTVLPDYWRVLL